MNYLILFTGIIEKEYINYYLNFPNDLKKNILFSTWNSIDNDIIQLLLKNNFNVIQNNFLDDMEKTSVNYQNYITNVGVKYAIENNYTHVLRLRADLLPTDLNKLIITYKKIYKEKKIN